MNQLRRLELPLPSEPDLGRRWPQTLLDLLDHHAVVVRVVLASLRGSAPRDAGSSMLVTADRSLGSIGGGYLEWDATLAARALLAVRGIDGEVLRHRLGLELAQCCGGVVDLWIERWTAADRPLLQAAAAAVRHGQPTLLDSRLDGNGRLQHRLQPAGDDQRLHFVTDDRDGSARLLQPLDLPRAPLWLFGAGHVGQALAPIVAGLPFRLRWIDSRPEIFPAGIAAAIEVCVAADPVATVAEAPVGCRFLLMTHDHQIDYALCQALLRRGDAAFIGMIGSASKAARFRSRLARDGLDASAIACPVGLAGITSKLPAAIAVSVAAQLLQQLAAAAAPPLPADDGCQIGQPQGCAGCGTRRIAARAST
ncbi:MAG: xanthine dehydrogenase accessory protein XdhC [Xanthomonadaceae bacterium]|nr:xanthine dehydrogenase accessory protein XdhC [Xanthomonadaceae bacterium]